MPVLVQLAEHEVKVGLFRKLHERVGGLYHPQVSRRGVKVALGKGEDDSSSEGSRGRRPMKGRGLRQITAKQRSRYPETERETPPGRRHLENFNPWFGFDRRKNYVTLRLTFVIDTLHAVMPCLAF